MTEIKTARHGAEEEQRTRQRVRVPVWTVAKYVFLTACGFALYRAGAACALAERGYEATGGEVLLLLFPIFYYAISAMVLDVRRDIKIFKEEKEKKHLYEIEAGTRFQYGGVGWVKLSMGSGTVLALAAEPVFERAFDGNNCNNWEASSLRRELNGTFLDALVEEGADKTAYLTFFVDLTADDGMKDYEATKSR